MPAAVTDPKFRLTWIKDASVRAHATQLLQQVVSSTVLETDMSGANAVLRPSSDEDVFFNFGTSMKASSKQRLEYLNDNSKKLAMVEKYPLVKHQFIRYNTCIAAYRP